MTDYGYYPGCSLHSTGREFDESVRAVFAALAIGLVEIEDWNCCGASSAHSVSRRLSLALPARNLALAGRLGRDIVMPCAACYNRHRAAALALREDAGFRAGMAQALGEPLDSPVAVRPLLDVLCNDVGVETIADRVTRPLTGLRLVSYYGCLLVRPRDVTQFDDPEHPVLMDRLLEALGADVRQWSYATECCGGGLSLTKPTAASRLVGRLAAHAREAGAEALVTSCPLCQVNLEMRQPRGAGRLPILYVSEVVGLAMGLPEAERWWPRHLIDPRPLLQTVEAVA